MTDGPVQDNISEGKLYALFTLGRLELALDGALVREIVKCPDIGGPLTPPAKPLAGYIKVRDMLVPILDLKGLLRKKKGPNDTNDSGPTRALLTTISGHIVAIPADAVSDIEEIGAERLKEAPSDLRLPLKKYVSYILITGDSASYLLDPERLLTAAQKKKLFQDES